MRSCEDIGRVDLNENDRIGNLSDLLRTVSGLTDPQAVQLEFQKRMRGLNEVDAYVAVSRRGLENGQYKITRSSLPAARAYHEQNPWDSWDELPAHAGGFLGSMVADDQPKLFSTARVTDDPVLGDALEPFRSMMIVPLFDEGRALNWSLMLRREENAFAVEELENLFLRGNLIGRMTKNLIVQREVKDLNQRLNEQLDEIASIQRALLPPRLPDVPRLRLASSYLTSNHAGGDYYDVIPLADGRWIVLIADVSGHGAGAATVVAMMNAILHAYDRVADGPTVIMRHLNRQLLSKRIESNFVTAFLGLWNPDDRTFNYVNAGHHSAMVRHPDGEISHLTGGHDVPLGILDDAEFEDATSTLQPGDTVVLYTDGIIESFGPPPAHEMFGLERFADALRACSGEPSCVMNTIHERLYEHTGQRERDDDQTLLAFRVEG